MSWLLPLRICQAPSAAASEPAPSAALLADLPSESQEKGESEQNSESQQKGIESQQKGIESQQKGIESQHKGIEPTKKGESEQKGIKSEQKGVESKQIKGIESEQKGMESEQKGIESDQQGIESEQTGVEFEQKGIDESEQKAVDSKHVHSNGLCILVGVWRYRSIEIQASTFVEQVSASFDALRATLLQTFLSGYLAQEDKECFPSVVRGIRIYAESHGAGQAIARAFKHCPKAKNVYKCLTEDLKRKFRMSWSLSRSFDSVLKKRIQATCSSTIPYCLGMFWCEALKTISTHMQAQLKQGHQEHEQKKRDWHMEKRAAIACALRGS